MSMQVTYTLKNYNLRETSKGRGILSYSLVDKEGHNRKVSAVVKLGFRNKIVSMHPLHQRELPLLDVLKKASINETIQVDFTDYNTRHPRSELSTQAMKGAKNTSVSYAEQEHLINDMKSLSTNKLRIFQMLGVAVVVFAAVMSVRHSFF